MLITCGNYAGLGRSEKNIDWFTALVELGSGFAKVLGMEGTY